MEQALRREIEEETGLTVCNIEHTLTQEFIFGDAFYERRHFIFFDFLCQTDAGEDAVTLNAESEAYVWVMLEEALVLPLEPYTRMLIEHVMRVRERRFQMKKQDRAVSYFDEGFSCAQAVLATFAPQFGLTTEQALRVAGSFGSGMAGRGQTCGAVTGAMMVIGLQEGKTRGDDDAARDRCYAVVDAFVTQFECRHGSIMCRELLGCDISTPEGMIYARENNLFNERCPTFVGDAAEIIEQVLD